MPCIFVYFLCLIVSFLIIHNVFVCILQCLKQKTVWKECYVVYVTCQQIIGPHIGIFNDHTSYKINVVDCISSCRLELVFLYHEKHSLTFVLSAEHMSNKVLINFVYIVNFGANIYKLIVQIVAILLKDTNQLDTQPGSQCPLGRKLQYHQLPYSSQYFLLKLHTRFLLTNGYKRVSGIFFIFFRSWVICKNLKNLVSTHSFLYNFINNSRSKQNKNYPEHFFQILLRRKCVQNFSKKY